MKMCMPHWTLLKKAVDDFGMSHLVNKSAEAAHAQMVAELEEGCDHGEIDPLLAIDGQLKAGVIERAGLYVLMERTEADEMPENDGHYCPLCIIKNDFDHHNTPAGKCDIEECKIRVKPGDEPWDTLLLTRYTKSLREHLINAGKLPRLQ